MRIAPSLESEWHEAPELRGRVSALEALDGVDRDLGLLEAWAAEGLLELSGESLQVDRCVAANRDVCPAYGLPDLVLDDLGAAAERGAEYVGWMWRPAYWNTSSWRP